MVRRRRHVVFAAAFLIVLAFFWIAFSVAVVHGDSMLPTYRSGEMVLVDRLNLLGAWTRGDVVLAKANNEHLIKRVFRLPGETLTEREAQQFRLVTDFFEPTHDAENPLRVPPGQVVILGDNAAVSDDSRLFGPIKTSEVVGRVLNAPRSR